jgi:two-component system response regulator YesN
MYYYPVDIELRFMNAVKAGEAAEAKRILAQVLEQNFAERDLSLEMVHQLIVEMKATLLKSFDPKVLPDSEGIQEMVLQIQPADGLKHVCESMERVIESYCRHVIDRRKETDHEVVKTILQYLEECYGNAELTLNMIAEKVGRPEKYVSQLFKEQTGEYLSDFLEKTRIQKATELLLFSEKTIEDIS